MTTTVTLRWVAATNATSGSTYKIYNDTGTAGTFVLLTTASATDRGDGSYTPYSTTLNQGGTLTATGTSLTLTSGTNFSQGDYVVIDREMIQLGTKSTNTFSGCTRGVGGTVPRTHTDGSTVYKAHETTADAATFGASRYVIRYRIAHVLSASESIPVEVTAVNPPDPPDTSFITLYGIREDENGGPKSGETATLTITATNPYGFDTGESLYSATKTTTVGSDGFFYFYVRRDSVVAGRSAVSLSVGSTAWTVASLPDQANVNFLET